MPVILEQFAFASLPAPGTAGRLVRLTDRNRGLWIDTGTQWHAIDAEVYNVRDFGAVGDNTTDDFPAFQAALSAIEAQNSAIGAILLVPYSTQGYYLSQTLNIVRPIVLQGTGGRGFASYLRFPDYTDGIIVHSASTAPPGHSGNGSGTIVQNIEIATSYQFGPPIFGSALQGEVYPPAYNEYDPLLSLHGSGIVLFANATIRDCSIYYFRLDGIHIQSDVSTKNANSTLVQNCIFGGLGRHAIYTQGDNANACVFIDLIIQANSGWAVYERGFLGILHLAVNATQREQQGDEGGDRTHDQHAPANDAVRGTQPSNQNDDRGRRCHRDHECDVSERNHVARIEDVDTERLPRQLTKNPCRPASYVEKAQERPADDRVGDNNQHGRELFGRQLVARICHGIIEQQI